MGVLTLLRRRLGTHPLALTGGRRRRVSCRWSSSRRCNCCPGRSRTQERDRVLGVGPSGAVRADSTVSVNASIVPASLPAADAVVRPRLEELADDVDVSRVAYPTARRDPWRRRTRPRPARRHHRAAGGADLVSGRWAARTGVGISDRGGAARAGGGGARAHPGQDPRADEPHRETDPDLTVTVVGTYRVREHAAAIWLDDPLSPVGVRQTDYTTYGPLVLGPGVFETGLVGKTQVTWRRATQFQEATRHDRAEVRVSVADTLDRLRAEVGRQPRRATRHERSVITCHQRRPGRDRSDRPA